MWQLKSNDLSAKGLLLEESLFSIGNGYIGVRGCLDEATSGIKDTIRGSYINGYYDIVPILYGEKAYGFPTVQDKQPRIMDTQTSLIFLDGEQLVFEASRLKDYYRVLDFKKGVSERGYIYTTDSGREAKVSFRRLASFTAQNLLCYSIDVEYKGEIEIISYIDSEVSNHSDSDDPRVAAGNEKLLMLKKLYVQDNKAFCEMETIASKIPLLTVVDYMGECKDGGCKIEHVIEEQRIATSIKGNNLLSVQKNCIFMDGIRAESIYISALELQSKYQGISFNQIMKEQEMYLRQFWSSSDIEIFGNEGIQKAIRFQLFQLLQSVGKDVHSNISAKGLSGEGYEGHYFWDTEIYVLPLLQLTQPKLAQKLLLYRRHILPQARNRAKELGHSRGAAYPWRTISGIECSSYFPAGTAQYHINADIAYGFIQYHLYHRDNDFMLEAGAEVIFETARIWLEIGHWHKGAYHIDDVTGPDEYTAIVNNNYYTNAMAKYHMYWAGKLYDELMSYDNARFKKLCSRISLTEKEIDEMRHASEFMYLPYDEELGIYAQDDSFLKKAVWDFEGTKENQYPLLLHFHPLTIYRYQVLKQADTVLAHFLLEDYAEPEAMKKSFDYYEKITTHDSSLSSCIYGIMACRYGYIDKAKDFFMESLQLDLGDTHGNTKDGLHMANLAGSCLGVIYGFAGFRVKEAGISLSPIVPKGMDGYGIKVHYRGSWLEVAVQEQVSIKLLQGGPVKVKVYDYEYLIEDTVTIERKQ
ncbi:MAG: glycoside hydrolase family 65 [Clostridia bacterium]|jgi:alpha,alpha-trehalose phosphorylase|nr:glycoside hydrolase family 65 [Clostridia bacterium]